jgi:cytosine/adenosine deaminase-related metal-dependent hydrolase
MTVGRTGSVQVPPGAKVIDARGKWLIPGLIDMHMHVGSRLDMPMGLHQGLQQPHRGGVRSHPPHGEGAQHHPAVGRADDRR